MTELQELLALFGRLGIPHEVEPGEGTYHGCAGVFVGGAALYFDANGRFVEVSWDRSGLGSLKRGEKV